MQIQFSMVTPDNTTDFAPTFLYGTANSSIIQGSIPGCGCGQSCGRDGGLMRLFPNYNGATYARRNCTSGFDSTSETNKVNEIGVVFFDDNLERLKEVTLVPDGKNFFSFFSENT